MLKQMEKLKCIFLCWVSLGLYIYVSSVSMRINVIFCIYVHILKYVCSIISNCLQFPNLQIYFVLKGSPHPQPPLPHPRRQQKSPARGKQNWKKLETNVWWFSMILFLKSPNNTVQGGLKISLKLNYSGRFPKGGLKKGNPTMTTSTVTAKRKWDLQHYVEGTKIDYISKSIHIYIYIYTYLYICISET